MKFLTLLPLAVVASGFVVPDGQMTEQIVLEGEKSQRNAFASAKDTVYHTWSSARDIFDDAIEKVRQTENKAASVIEELQLDATEWVNDATKEIPGAVSAIYEDVQPAKLLNHHHHHEKPNKTIYELITESKYTTEFAKLLQDYPDAIEVLNGTETNITYFVPINKAFEKIPKHHKEPSHEDIAKVLMYHGSPDFYPAGRVLASHTLPSALNVSILDDQPQRLRVGLTLKGLTVNFYARIVAIDIFATNGVVHAVEDFIIPPPGVLDVIEFLPGSFSTLELALLKTGLAEEIAKDNSTAGTLFAPDNFAFSKLPPKLNAFLFSKHGLKYLKAVLEYHMVPNVVLYSDAYYTTSSSSESLAELEEHHGCSKIPKRKIHADLPTALEGKSLAVDIIRFGGLIDIRINGFTSVSVQDIVAENGVIQQIGSVLVPPKKPGMAARVADDSMTVEEFKEAFEPFVRH